jgi:Na+/melibiose symporter-like transporter
MKTQGGEFWIVNKVDSSFHYCIVVLVCLCYVGVMTQLVIFFLQKVLSTKNLKVALFFKC